jgi:hypothetical protein
MSVSVTSAPGTDAPEGSVTTPVTAPVYSCAQENTAEQSKSSSVRASKVGWFFSYPFIVPSVFEAVN